MQLSPFSIAQIVDCENSLILLINIFYFSNWKVVYHVIFAGPHLPSNGWEFFIENILFV